LPAVTAVEAAMPWPWRPCPPDARYPRWAWRMARQSRASPVHLPCNHCKSLPPHRTFDKPPQSSAGFSPLPKLHMAWEAWSYPRAYMGHVRLSVATHRGAGRVREPSRGSWWHGAQFRRLEYHPCRSCKWCGRPGLIVGSGAL